MEGRRMRREVVSIITFYLISPVGVKREVEGRDWCNHITDSEDDFILHECSTFNTVAELI
jgi:hypothetical protein